MLSSGGRGPSEQGYHHQDLKQSLDGLGIPSVPYDRVESGYLRVIPRCVVHAFQQVFRVATGGRKRRPAAARSIVQGSRLRNFLPRLQHPKLEVRFRPVDL